VGRARFERATIALKVHYQRLEATWDCTLHLIYSLFQVVSILLDSDSLSFDQCA